MSFAAAMLLPLLALAFTSSGAENKTSTLTEVFLGVAIIFLIGFAIGSVVFWIYPGHSSIVRRLDTHLNGVLSGAERDLLGPTILSMADKGLYEINGRAEMEARMASLRQQATDLRLDVVKELLFRGRF